MNPVFSLLIGVLGTIIGLTALVRSRRGTEQAWRIAEGTSKRSGLNVAFFGDFRCRGVYILAPRISDHALMLPIDVTMMNFGANSMRNVEAYVRVSDLTPLKRGKIADMEGQPTGRAVRLATTVQKMTVSSFDVGELRPH